MKKHASIVYVILIFLLGSVGLYWIADNGLKIASFDKEKKTNVPFESSLLAKEGESIDQYNRGKILAEIQVPPDNKRAVKWYALAAKKGYTDAQNDLGVMYEKGRGVKQNYKTALKWYSLAAKQGEPVSQHNLAVMYENGQGIKQSYKSAIKWYTLAAKQGYVDSQNNLGVIYELSLIHI